MADEDITVTPDKNISKQESVIPDQILSAIPEEERKKVQQIISTSFQGVFPTQNPLVSKITPQHITSILANSDEEDKRDRQERKDERRHNLLILVIVFIFILVACGGLLHYGHADLVKFVVTGLFSFGGGFGVGKWYKREED